MFGRLFLKECRITLKSVTYFLFIIVLVLDFMIQLGSYTGVHKPVPGQERYGYISVEDPEVIMTKAMERLLSEYSANKYYTYPIGFVKVVKLNEQEQQQVLETIEYLSIATREQIESFGEGKMSLGDICILKPEIDYDEFMERMQTIDTLLGGGSYYEEDLRTKTSVPMTYEEALEVYQTFIEEDNISKAYARVFADYLGITLAILPVFLAVARVLREKRNKVEENIYSRKASSVTIVLSRVAAIVTMTILPVFVLSITPGCQMMYNAKCNGVAGDWLALPEVILGWLLPTVIVTVGIAYFLTELTQGPVTILLQGVWWFLDLNMNSSIVGGIGAYLMPRFNDMGSRDIFEAILPELVWNRVMYTMVGLFFIAATVVLYHLKRKGVFNYHGRLSLHRAEQS